MKTKSLSFAMAALLVAGTVFTAQSASANSPSYNIGKSSYYQNGKSNCSPTPYCPPKNYCPPTYCPQPPCPPAVPEPSTNALLGVAGLIGGVFLLRRRKSSTPSA